MDGKADNDNKLAAKQNSNEENERFVPSWASGEKLRKIEAEVLIPNMMKKKAKVICKEYLDKFSECCNGRTLSMAWSCGEETKAMRKCLTEQLDNKELYEECRVKYLQNREEFQQHYVETGSKTNPKRKQNAVF